MVTGMEMLMGGGSLLGGQAADSKKAPPARLYLGLGVRTQEGVVLGVYSYPNDGALLDKAMRAAEKDAAEADGSKEALGALPAAKDCGKKQASLRKSASSSGFGLPVATRKGIEEYDSLKGAPSRKFAWIAVPATVDDSDAAAGEYTVGNDRALSYVKANCQRPLYIPPTVDIASSLKESFEADVMPKIGAFGKIAASPPYVSLLLAGNDGELFGIGVEPEGVAFARLPYAVAGRTLEQEKAYGALTKGYKAAGSATTTLEGGKTMIAAALSEAFKGSFDPASLDLTAVPLEKTRYSPKAGR